jgi:hypothetical protein
MLKQPESGSHFGLSHCSNTKAILKLQKAGKYLQFNFDKMSIVCFTQCWLRRGKHTFFEVDKRWNF